MQLKSICLSALLAGCCLYGSQAAASSVIQQPFATITEQAELVFEGHVTGLWTETEGKKIFTWVEFSVDDVIKGSYANKRISLRYFGGGAGDTNLKVDGVKLPSLGEQGVYFVNSLSTRTVHPLVGWGQGHFLLKSSDQGQSLKVYDSHGKPVAGIEQNTAANGPVKLSTSTAAGVQFATSATGALDLDAFKAIIKGVK